MSLRFYPLQIHLSAYERLNRKYKKKLSIADLSFSEGDIEAVKNAGAFIRDMEGFEYDQRVLKTVAVMPFLGVDMGAGHSVLSNRYEYLKVCFWSVYPIIPNIVIGVLSSEDVDWIKYKILLKNLAIILS